jgi:hypothetical protein
MAKRKFTVEELEPNLPVIRKESTGRKTAFETTERINILEPLCGIGI